MQQRRSATPTSVLRASAGGHIVIPRRAEVGRFLANDRQLAVLVPTICESVRDRLGPAVELSLELYKDPEIDDQYLTLYVRQDRYDISIMDRIDAAREELAPVLDGVAGRLLITTDFCPPRGGSADGAKPVRGPSRRPATTRSNSR